jgi:hypothetical protein
VARACGPGPRRTLLAAALVAGLAAANATRIPREVAVARARSATAARMVDLVARERLGQRDVVHVDFAPPELFDGLPELIQLHGGGRPRVVNHWVVARPPFLIHMNPEFADLAAEQPILRWDEPTRSFVPTSKGELVAGRQLVPTFGFRHRLVVVGDWSVVRYDSDTVHLRPPPDPPLTPAPASDGARNRVVSYGGGTLTRIDLSVDAPRDAYLVIAFIADLRTVGGRAFVDGNEVPLLVADALFNAIAVPAGSREVVVKTDL